MTDVIKRPIVTEKAMKLQSATQYCFEVDLNSNKITIKNAIEKMFEVNVVSIRTTRVKPKVKTRYTRKGIQRGKTSERKKAYVTLKEGQTIDVVTGAPGE